MKNAARLRVLTDLWAIKKNVARWSSNYAMGRRYIEQSPTSRIFGKLKIWF
jgi:hypothetical protein